MYTNHGECPVCGTDVDYPASVTFDRFNRDRLVRSGPFFCSESCYHQAIHYYPGKSEADCKDTLENYIKMWDFEKARPLSLEELEERQERRHEKEAAEAKRLEETRKQEAKEAEHRRKREEKEADRLQRLQDREDERRRVREEREQEKRAEEEAYLEKHGPDLLDRETEEGFADTEDELAAIDGARAYLYSLVPDQQGDPFGWMPVIDAVSNPIDALQYIYTNFSSVTERKRLRDLFRIPLDKPVTIREEARLMRSANPHDLVAEVFAGGPLGGLLSEKVEILVPEHVRHQHSLLVAATGAGKTTVLQDRFLYDIDSNDPPAIVVIDPKGEMVDRLKRLDVFAPGYGWLDDKLEVLDATKAPALNLFAHAPEHLPQRLRERIENQTIDLLEYIFSSSEFKLTPKQSVGFSFLARLMFKIPRADLHTFLDVIDERPDFKKGEQSKYLPYIRQLDGTAQRFFQQDFFGEFNETKSQIKSRIYMVLKSPELSRIFNATSTTIDWFDALQSGKIVLVNTGLNQIGEDASRVFGRYIMASVYAAACARALVPKAEWRSAYLIVDEAQLYVDEKKTQQMLSLAREYKLGITLATQQMTGDGFSDNIKNALSTNTSIKYAASVGIYDMPMLAKDMQTDPEFIRSHTTSGKHVRMACYVRNIPIKKPFTVSLIAGNVERESQMSQENVDLLDRIMAERYHDVGESHYYLTDGETEYPDGDVNAKPYPRQAIDEYMKRETPEQKSDDDPDYFPRS